LKQARSISTGAVDQAQQISQRERASLWEAGAAVREAFFGNRGEARKHAYAALQFSRDREAEYGAALAFALAGESSRAEALADDLQRRFPEDTSVRSTYLPVVRAQLALNRGDALGALEALQVAADHELGAQHSTVDALFGALYPVYFRGEAYLAAHEGAKAAAEFQKILKHRGIVIHDPVAPSAHLELARAYASAGDAGKAKAAYQEFFTLWKDADADIPLLNRARSEYQELK
jgi:eukaryotic-like serine/threonine-protein kinase